MKNLKRFGILMLSILFVFGTTLPICFAADDAGFPDVPADAWYAEAVTYCLDHHLMAGVDDGRFAPAGNLTRSQFAAVLYRMEGTPDVTGTDAFTDTLEGMWYSDAVLWASQQSLISGYGNGLFGTDDAVSREQMAAILWRYADSPAASSAKDYQDKTSVAAYAASAVDWVSGNQIMIPRSDDMFAPKEAATRAEIAFALMQYSRQQAVPPQPNENNGAVLIAYFSATGNTEAIAMHLKDILNADVYEIVPEQPYTAEDLAYSNSSSRTSQEMNDPNARPAIVGEVENMQQYDTIFLGYPIWWGQAPKIISIFLESNDLSGKTIVPFCTSASSGLGSSAENLHSFASAATWLEGNRFSGNASNETVKAWVDGLNIHPAA